MVRESKNIDSETELAHFVESYAVEYNQIPTHRHFNSECFDIIGEILIQAFRPDKRTLKVEKSLERIHPIFESFEKGLRTLGDVETTMESHNRSDKELFYVGCFLYLLTVEALYEEAVRFLYGLKLIVKRKVETDRVFESIANLKLSTIRNSRILPNVIFEGWEDGHLRNAIAHGHVEYNQSTGEMTFTDYDPRTRKENYKNELALSDFQSYGHKLRQIPFLVLYTLKALLVRDIIRSD